MLQEMSDQIAKMEAEHFRYRIASQEPFIRGETFYFGAWRQWLRASEGEKQRLLSEFEANHAAS